MPFADRLALVTWMLGTLVIWSCQLSWYLRLRATERRWCHDHTAIQARWTPLAFPAVLALALFTASCWPVHLIFSAVKGRTPRWFPACPACRACEQTTAAPHSP